MRNLPELAGCIDRLHATAGRHPDWLPGLTLSRATRVTEPLSDVTRPVLALIAQGAKRTVLADRVYDYQAGQYLIATVDLPLSAKVTRATPAEPFLGLGLPLNEHLIADLLLETGTGVAGPEDQADPGIVVADAADDLVDAVVRLLHLAGQPPDFAVLGPAAEREIHWRLMNGPHAATVRRIGMAGSRVSLVGRAVRWLAEHYDQPIRIADLAGHVGVSVPTLNRHFRAVTAMSPLQYQKQLRLQRARVELLAAPGDVAAVGYAVGYDSPSQFSREYRRLFGVPPGQDAHRLLATGVDPDPVGA
ncbi:MAG TPA: AraC family transcriptional regulator [Streptosporangiaceae bacterium]|nr:AraC family transcriptional regulator [Streptosporangiaceae bacterium]